MNISKAMIDNLRRKYPTGTRIELISTSDLYSELQAGDNGTVEFVDDIGTVFVKWDCGSGLGLVYGEDRFRAVEEASQPKDIIKASDFVGRTRYELSDAEWEEVMSYPYFGYEEIEDIDNPKYDWKQCVRKNASDYKYGRQMVSFTQKIRRGQTMGEFYGSGIVD